MTVDKAFFGLVSQVMPKFNANVCNGLATVQIPDAMRYVDRLVDSAQKIFPPGLVYRGCQRVTPEEEYRVVTQRGSSNTTTLEVARSDMFMVKLSFTFDGLPIEDRYMYLPFVGQGGTITIRGARYTVSPLLTDSSVSVGVDSIFIPVGQAKITYRREGQNYLRNGKVEMADVVWAKIYRRKQKTARVSGYPVIKANTCLMHYLLCKYGLVRTFSMMRGVDIIYGDHTNITEELYPPAEWSIFTSTGQPSKYIKDKYAVATTLRLAVRNTQYDFIVASMVAGVFYIVELFSQRLLPEYIDGSTDELRLWRILLGHLIFPPGGSEGRLVDDVNNHLETVDEYLDILSREDLEKDGVQCSDIYDLFMRVIETFNQRVTKSGSRIASMADKRLVVLKFALYDIRKAIYMMSYMLKSKAKKRLLADDVKKIMRKFLKYNLAVEMNTGHGEVTSISSPGDSMYFKLTSTLVPQTNSSGMESGGSKSQASMADPSKFLHPTIAEVGSFSNLPKSDPSGRSRVNPYLTVEADGTIVHKPQFAALLESVQQKIKR
jgi:hypothetical protein